MIIQFLFIFVNKEPSKGQKKLNTRPEKAKGGKGPCVCVCVCVLSLNEKLKGVTFRRHELPRCAIHSCSAPGRETLRVPTFCSQPSNNFGHSELKQEGIM